MEDKESSLDTLIERTENFIKTSKELYRLRAIDKTSEIISGMASWLVIVIIFALFFMILNIGLALWLNEILGKPYYGFFVLSGLYAVLTLIILIFNKRWIKRPIRNSIISQLINNSDGK